VKKRAVIGVCAVAMLAVSGCMGVAAGPDAQGSAESPSTSPSPSMSSSTSVSATPSATPTPSAAPVISTNVQFLDPRDVDRSSAEGVARAAVRMITTWDPAHDRTETAGAVRAKPLFTKDLADRTIEPQRPATGDSWHQAAQAGAWSSPTLTKKPNTHQHYSSESPETHEGEEFTFTVNWVWVVTSTGERVPDPERREYRVLAVEEETGMWSIADWTYEPVLEAPMTDLNLEN
jgi:hypothetical protein